MNCTDCGKRYIRGNACCRRAKKPQVKRPDNASRTLIHINAESGMFKVSQSQLQGTWPGGIERARSLGNHVLYPKDIIGRHPLNEDKKAANTAFEWLKSHLAPSSQQINPFDKCMERLRRVEAYGYSLGLSKWLDDFFLFLYAIELLFVDHGVGKDMKDDVVSMGLQAAPVLAPCPRAAFKLIRAMWKILKEDKIVSQIVNTISRTYKSELNCYCWQQMRGKYATIATKILMVINPGLSETDIQLIAVAKWR